MPRNDFIFIFFFANLYLFIIKPCKLKAQRKGKFDKINSQQYKENILKFLCQKMNSSQQNELMRQKYFLIKIKENLNFTSNAKIKEIKKLFIYKFLKKSIFKIVSKIEITQIQSHQIQFFIFKVFQSIQNFKNLLNNSNSKLIITFELKSSKQKSKYQTKQRLKAILFRNKEQKNKMLLLSRNQILKILTLTIFLVITLEGSMYSYSKCASNQILNTKTLTCQICPINKQPNKNQLVPNQCICKNGWYPNVSGGCTQYFVGSSTLCAKNQFINAFNNDGSKVSTPITACTACSANAYQNTNGTGCIPCMKGMTYNVASQKCQCSDSSQSQTAQGCFPQSYTSDLGLVLSSSAYSSYLKYLVPGCYYFKDPLSCSQIVNLCIYSMVSSAPQCQFFTKASMTNYLYSQSANVYAQTSVSKSSEIKMKLVYFSSEGNYIRQKDLSLADLFRCGLPSNADVSIVVGSNIEVKCDYNFNNLVAQMGGQDYQRYVYQLLIQGQNGNYYEVNAYLNGNSQAVKRFFLEDSFTSKASVNVATGVKLEITMNSDGALVNPSIYLTYTKLSIQLGSGITPKTQQIQEVSHLIQFTSQLSGFWSVVLPIFIVLNVLIILHAVAKTYVGYLNRKSPFLFFLNFMNVWSLWIFYFLMVTTGYWFLFTKNSSTVYTFISSSDSLYITFYIIFGLMIAFRLISILLDKSDKLNMQIFLINWEKQKLDNSWRSIFIINSLTLFSTYRTFSVFWIMMVMLFFVTGFRWEEHSREVISTSLDSIQYFHKKNSIFLYFLSTTVLLVIAIIFKILRRLSVLYWPYPFEEFVDYCSITNISFFFMKKRSPQAYYIHADLPNKAEVTYREINTAVRSGLLKNRSITNQIAQQNGLRLYVAYVNRDLQQKFNLMLKKEQDQDHNRNSKYKIGSSVSIKPSVASSKNPFYFRQEFIEKKLKPSLEQILQKNSNRQKTWFQSFFHVPPQDLRNQRGLNQTHVFMDSSIDMVKEVFPNGDEFEQIHTIIIMYLLWVVVTQSSPIAAFLTYFCDEFIINTWIRSSYRKHLEKMTKVKEGFML